MSFLDKLFGNKNEQGYAPSSIQEWRRVTSGANGKLGVFPSVSESCAAARFGVTGLDTPTAICAGITAVGVTMLIGGTLAAITFTPAPLVCAATGATIGLCGALVGGFEPKELLAAGLVTTVGGMVGGLILGSTLTPIVGGAAAIGGALAMAVAYNTSHTR